MPKCVFSGCTEFRAGDQSHCHYFPAFGLIGSVVGLVFANFFFLPFAATVRGKTKP